MNLRKEVKVYTILIKHELFFASVKRVICLNIIKYFFSVAPIFAKLKIKSRNNYIVCMPRQETMH